MNKIAVKIIFYALVIGVAFGAALLYFRSTAPTPTPIVTADNNPSSLATTGSSANNSNPPASVTAPKPSKPTCIIIIDGQKYDVQPLRSTHSGGDVFQCNTDMSNVFHGQHGDNLRMIQKYLVK